jgi:hypothetical protein
VLEAVSCKMSRCIKWFVDLCVLQSRQLVISVQQVFQSVLVCNGSPYCVLSSSVDASCVSAVNISKQ